MSIGVSMSSESVMARLVASVSTSCGREVAWYLGSKSPFSSSLSVIQERISPFSAWIIVVIPFCRAVRRMSRIWLSRSWRAS